MRTPPLLISIVLAVACLAMTACGQRGPLRLPDATATPHKKPAPAPAGERADAPQRPATTPAAQP
ncbi:MAG: lipoprotein [Comamonadaceae bacterium]|nr:lipoprotein [Burkholderiales bacterium]MEB2349071.1 lipoprotein [Comamonadaceae bacterium]